MIDSLWQGALLGGTLGLLFQVGMVAWARKRRARDVVRFTADTDLTPHVDAWAAANGYRRVAPGADGATRWRKGNGFLTAARHVELHAGASEQHLDAFIVINAFVAKADLALSDAGFLGKPIRAKALGEFNGLLASLQLPQVAPAP